MCSKSVQVLHRTCKPVANWRLYCTLRRLPFVDWPINLGPAQQSSAGLLHLERWQANGIRKEPQATENPVRRFPTGVSMPNVSVNKNSYSYEESRDLPDN